VSPPGIIVCTTDHVLNKTEEEKVGTRSGAKETDKGTCGGTGLQ
jgi:hypothetical protein